MPLAPAFTSYKQVVSAATLTSASFTPDAGDVLVVKTGTWSTGTSPGTPTDSSGQVWTQQEVEAGGGFNGQVQIWTAVVGEGGAPSSPGAITVSITPGASCHHCLLVEHWPGAQLAGTPATGSAFTNGSAAPSASLISTRDGSVVSWVCYDNNSTSPVGRAYLASATEEAVTSGVGGSNGIFYHAYQDAPVAGSQTFGLSAPATMRYNIAGIEIQAAPSSDLGALAGTTPAPSGALTGSVIDAAALAGTTPAPSGSLAAALSVAAALAGSTSPPSGSLAASLADVGTLAGVTPRPAGALAAAVRVAAALAGLTRAPSGTLTNVRPTLDLTYPLRAGAVTDHVTRARAGVFIDHVERLRAAERTS